MTLATSLTTLETSGLIRLAQMEPELEYLFRHALVQEATYASILKADRRVLHRVVAETLERLYPEHLDALAFLLGQHWREGGEMERARQYFIRAGEVARKIYANGEAIAAYTEALSLTTDDAERFGLLAARVAVYDVITAREEQRGDIDSMMALAEKLNDDARRCDAFLVLSDYHLNTEHVLAREPAEQALELARKLSDPLRDGRALLRLGSEALRRSAGSESRNWLEMAETLFRETGHLQEMAPLLNEMGIVLFYLGEYLAVEKYLKEAVELSRVTRNRRQEGIGLRRLAILYLQLRQPEEAYTFIENALAIHRELGDSAQECNALQVLGNTHFFWGGLVQAKTYYYQSLEIAESVGYTETIESSVERLIRNYFHPTGEYADGLTFVKRRIEKARQISHEFLIFDLLDDQAFLLADIGQYAEALEIRLNIQPFAERRGQKFVASGLIFIGHLHIMLGQFDQANETLATIFNLRKIIEHPVLRILLLFLETDLVLVNGKASDLRTGLEQGEQAVILATEGNFENLLVSAYTQVAHLYLALGEIDNALTNTRQAVQAIEKLPIPFDYDYAYITHSRALRANGHDAEADEYLQKAYDRVMLVASKTKDETLRQSWLENVRDNREIIAEYHARHPISNL